MSYRLFLIVTLSLLGTGTLVLQPIARAETPLTRATVQALRNQVQLIFKNRVSRAAQNADTMTPGDSLATARKSFAELRFNDNSLARIGERALFQFVPNTRNFYLGNGTALLLIPPGQGRTHIRTPNAAAGIRGSALFVRYNEDTNTTIVGALTNSRIEVSNGENPQTQTLKAGQMAVIIQNQVVQVYNFDLNTFYQTSELVKDLDLTLRNASPNADPGIAAVQSETAQAVREQLPLIGQVSENPAFVSLNSAPGLQVAVTPGSANQITLTPSGLDLSTARQTLVTNPSAQAFTTPATSTQALGVMPPVQLSIPSGASASVAATTQVTPITLPLNPQTIPAGTVLSGTPIPPASGVSTTPPVPAATAPVPTPAPTPAAAIPSPAASQPPASTPVAPADPVGSTTVKPSTPITVSPITPSGTTTVQPTSQTPTSAATVQPSIPVSAVTTPQPSPTAPVTPSSSSPVARPDPVATPPTPMPAVVQLAPTPVSPAADTSAVQTTIVTTPAVTPAPTTVQVQTGTAATSVPIQTGTTGGATTPASGQSTLVK